MRHHLSKRYAHPSFEDLPTFNYMPIIQNVRLTKVASLSRVENIEYEIIFDRYDKI